jgi:ABC-type nitrate/sulfonate/bicarbonate transport system permease component
MEVFASFTVWAAAIVAFIAGMAWQAAINALQNLRKTEESLPGLRKTKRDTRWRAVRRLLVALVVATLITMLVARFH